VYYSYWPKRKRQLAGWQFTPDNRPGHGSVKNHRRRIRELSFTMKTDAMLIAVPTLPHPEEVSLELLEDGTRSEYMNYTRLENNLG
jgi:hypothetical protein